jgi:hypothetical protein
MLQALSDPPILPGKTNSSWPCARTSPKARRPPTRRGHTRGPSRPSRRGPHTDFGEATAAVRPGADSAIMIRVLRISESLLSSHNSPSPRPSLGLGSRPFKRRLTTVGKRVGCGPGPQGCGRVEQARSQQVRPRPQVDPRPRRSDAPRSVCVEDYITGP